MYSQLVVCDEVIFNKTEKYHTLGKVINSLTIPVLPFVSNLFVYVKLINISKDDFLNITVTAFDNEGRPLVKKSTRVRNFRDAELVPGVDFHLELPCIFEKEGNYLICLSVDGKKINNYPIYVKLLS